jgi:hypothetical protein
MFRVTAYNEHLRSLQLPTLGLFWMPSDGE